MQHTELDLAGACSALGLEVPEQPKEMGADDARHLKELRTISPKNYLAKVAADSKKLEGDSIRSTFFNHNAAGLAVRLNKTRQRTLHWLNDIGYFGILHMWRDSTTGIMAVVEAFEAEVDEPFSPGTILDFMESHESWRSDLETITRVHAFQFDASWQNTLKDARGSDLAGVNQAKAMSQLLFDRAGTLNREQFSLAAPKDNSIGSNQVSIHIYKDGVDAFNPEQTAVATRQRRVAQARVKYGTSDYIDPPGLDQWVGGTLDIPQEKVNDYLMLEWAPFIEATAEVVEEIAVADTDLTEVATSEGIDIEELLSR